MDISRGVRKQMGDRRRILASIILTVIIVSTTPFAYAQDSSQATIKAQYREVKAIVYDKVRGVYGMDYSYDWVTNSYTTYSLPHKLGDLASPNLLILDRNLDDALWKGRR